MYRAVSGISGSLACILGLMQIARRVVFTIEDVMADISRQNIKFILYVVLYIHGLHGFRPFGQKDQVFAQIE